MSCGLVVFVSVSVSVSVSCGLVVFFNAGPPRYQLLASSSLHSAQIEIQPKRQLPKDVSTCT